MMNISDLRAGTADIAPKGQLALGVMCGLGFVAGLVLLMTPSWLSVVVTGLAGVLGCVVVERQRRYRDMVHAHLVPIVTKWARDQYGVTVSGSVVDDVTKLVMFDSQASTGPDRIALAGDGREMIVRVTRIDGRVVLTGPDDMLIPAVADSGTSIPTDGGRLV